MSNNMSKEMRKSICKSIAYGETWEKNAEMHKCSIKEIFEIKTEMADKIEGYKEFIKEMGC